MEVPIWLGEDDIAALEDKYRITIIPRQPLDPLSPDAGHKPRHITGHIDFLQARNDAIHILDYKPDARTNKPIAQLTIYSTASQTFSHEVWNASAVSVHDSRRAQRARNNM